VSKAIPEQTVKLGSETLNLQFPAPEKVRLRITIAFAPEEDDSLGSIFGRREAPKGGAGIYPDSKGFLWIKYDEFHQSFCQDLKEDEALVMSLSQKPIHGSGFSDQTTKPAAAAAIG
jgi:hypothetical protein